MAAKIVFITGTDTGAGKTVLTALALCHLQSRGERAAALKPFCSGSWEDTDFIRGLHRPPLRRVEVTRWFFKAPMTPLLAARLENQSVSLSEAIDEVAHRAADLDCLLVEGAGGLLAPLGNGFSAIDLIRELRAEVVIAARNKLGVINHALLTVRQLQTQGIRHWQLALMGGKLDESSESNLEALAECLKTDSARLHQIPELSGFDPSSARTFAALHHSQLNALFP